MVKSRILVAERDDALRAEISAALAADGFTVAHAADAEAVARQGREAGCADALIVGSTIRAPDDGLRAARATIARRPGLPVILIASESSEELAVAALRAGCVDYFKKPVPIPDLRASIRRRVGALRGAPECDTSESNTGGGIEMIGHSRPLREIRAYLLKVAATDSSALITGETGTGKELAAAMIHRHSARRTRPFVCINCAAIPDSLLESELFGYERGAFTGAQAPKEGTLMLADGGTVFFDEVGDLSPYAQAKLLRAIEMREARPLGARREVAFDIRVIAATNRDLQQLMAEQKFRADLFFRLNVASIHLPPLRVRKEDLIPLSRYYIGQMNGRSQRNVEGFSPETLDALMRYDWPGNVRELRNLIEAVFIEPPSRWIAPAHLPEMFRQRFAAAAESPGSERDRVLSALLATNWNKSRAAQKLRWSRMTLYRKMSRYQVVNQASLIRNPERTGPP
jgi:DNA-binding NtrC family response regulator